MPHFNGTIRELMQFMSGADTPFEKFEKVQSIERMNEETVKKNRARFKANIEPGPLKAMVQRAR